MDSFTVYHWMLLNGDKLADAIIEEHGMTGPKADKMLTEAQQINSPGKSKFEARKLLKRKLEAKGAGKYLDEETE